MYQCENGPGTGGASSESDSPDTYEDFMTLPVNI